jgi:hypothetical protein
MKLVVIHGFTTTHAPARNGYVFPGDKKWGKLSHAGTMCGKPSGNSKATTYYVDEVTPSCRRCQQLMTHWNRKPQA